MKTFGLVLAIVGLFTRTAAAESIPMPRALELEGLHAYAEKSLPAGETVRFRVSSTVPYELSICRLGQEVDDPAGDQVLFTFPESPPVGQPIHPGSFVHVAKGLPADQPLAAVTLECWVRPWHSERRQTLIAQYDAPTACGFGLFLDGEGRVEFYLGDGLAYREQWVHTGPKLERLRWQYVVGTWDGTTKSLWIDGERVGSWPLEGPVSAGRSALRLGGCGHEGEVVSALDGDLAMPAIYSRALSADEIAERFTQAGLEPARGDGVLAFWPLDEERGDRVADRSGNARHGRIINQATWMIGGPSFDGSQVPRYGDYDPAKDPQRGHGLRFASDDLYDCRWAVTHEYPIPESAKPGLYVGRFRFELDGTERLYHVVFVVKRPEDRPKAPLLVLASSNTWLAYNSTPFAVTPSRLQYNWGISGITNSPGDPPAKSMYRNHRAGQPAYQVGVNVPWPNAGPYVLYSAESVGYSHLMRAERFLHVWLEQAGYDYDMITDLDLHRSPELLEGYQVLVINGHSEYWSGEAYEAVDQYLCSGGNVMMLSGNSILWRVSFNEEGTIMECRKLAPGRIALRDYRFPGSGGLGGFGTATTGELWHSQDGRRGSRTRECGYPAWNLVGLSACGYWSPAKNTLYEVEDPDHFLFQKPEPVGLAKGDAFGGAPDGGFPRGVGHEPDIRLSLKREITKNIPPGATLPEEPSGIVTIAVGREPDASGLRYDYFTQPVNLMEAVGDDVACHMIYWERPRGGRVFHAGSVGASWGLSVDPKFQTLLRNVLFHFGVQPATERPETQDQLRAR